MATMKIEKLIDDIPSTLEANAVYLVRKENRVQCHIVNDTGLAVYNVTRVIDDVTLMGDALLTAFISEAITFNISNYSNFKIYTLSAISGTVSRVDDIITYTAPSTVQAGGFVINGRTIPIAINPVTLATPAITQPTEAQVAVGLPVVVNSSNLAVNEVGVDASIYGHASTDWQIASDINFANILEQSTADTVNKTVWNTTLLTSETTYYVRVRYNTTLLGTTPWSTPVMFTTAALGFPINFASKIIGSDSTITDEYSVTTTIDNFGAAVDMDGTGTRIVVGADQANVNTFDQAGAAYVFLRSGNQWIEEAKLIPDVSITSAGFGNDVSISEDGTRIAVGASMVSQGSYAISGNVYIFSRTGTVWTLEATITASDTSAGDFFGQTVDLDSTGTRLAVGATNAYNTGGDNGAVYIYTRSGAIWTEEQKLQGTGVVSMGSFGASLELSSDASRIVIGARDLISNTFVNAGVVYVFSRTGTVWTEEQVLIASDQAADEYFGTSVSISSDGTYIIVGKPSSGVGIPGIYSFVYTTSWAEEAISQKLDDTGFGISVSINDTGDRIIAGAMYYTDLLMYEGAAFVYQNNAGVLENVLNGKLLSPETEEYLSFGNAVAMSKNGNVVCVTQISNNHGAGFVFTV